MQTNANEESNNLCQDCQDVRERLNIDIARLFQDLNLLDDFERKIVCKSLKGCSPKKMAKDENIVDDEGKADSQLIRYILHQRIYPKLSKLLKTMEIDDDDIEDIKGNWAKITYHLLDQYSLGKPRSIPNGNTLMSFGERILLRRRNDHISELQQNGADLYCNRIYYAAFESFIKAWKEEKQVDGNGNPELLIYMSNCLIDGNEKNLRTKQVKIYTIAVVVPVEHNLGKVARELLYGVAQIQYKLNLQNLCHLSSPAHLVNWCKEFKNLSGDYFPLKKDDVTSNRKMVLRVLIVDESKNLAYQHNSTVNQVAEDLASEADKLEIWAIIGHYSSEMTKPSVEVYAKKGLFLITPSSSSDRLSELVNSTSFFRITTEDKVAAQRLTNYLANRPERPQRVAIIYNQHSSYCLSFRNAFTKAIREHLKQDPEGFELLDECGQLSNGYFQSVEPYLKSIANQNPTSIVIIPDGGIDPNSLNSVGTLSRLNMDRCLIAGSATFYHGDNLLEWAEENIKHKLMEGNNASNLVACVPWHFQSKKNGVNSDNDVAKDFCRLGAILWGEEKVSWRSATSYDCVLMIAKVLREKPDMERKNLLMNINQLLRYENQPVPGVTKDWVEGVTGKIKFSESGDRINPPTEIVAVRWNEREQRCEFVPE